MKNFTKLLLGSLVLFSLSGCTAGDMITSYTSTSDQSETTLQNTSGTPKQRVYMDEIKGTLKDFTGATLTMESQEQTYVFNLSEATLECEDGMITGDEISVIYEGQLSNKDTSTVKALKVVDDFHKKNQLEVRKAYGEVQSLTPNTITIKNKKGKTATYPITGTEQYYQGGIKAGNWVYLHYKGDFGPASADDPNVLDGSQMKIYSVSDIDPLNVPAPTPTPAPQEGVEIKPENKLRAVIQNIQTNILQVSPENTSNILNLDMSAIPCYFSGGIESGAHVNVIYTGDFNGTTLDGLTILGITGVIPENLSQSTPGFTISGEITASTANTITLLTSDGVRITCNTESASNESTGGLLTGSSVKVTFNPADSRQTNIYTALKIEDL